MKMMEKRLNSSWLVRTRARNGKVSQSDHTKRTAKSETPTDSNPSNQPRSKTMKLQTRTEPKMLKWTTSSQKSGTGPVPSANQPLTKQPMICPEEFLQSSTRRSQSGLKSCKSYDKLTSTIFSTQNSIQQMEVKKIAKKNI